MASSKALSIAFVGLGKMGSGMAKNLAAAGHSLSVFDIDAGSTRAVADAVSGSAAVSPSEAVTMALERGSTEGRAPVVVSMVPNDEVIEAVVGGEGGILEGLGGAPADTSLMHVSCSTVSPFTSRQLSEAGKLGNGSELVHISAPVFARPDGVAAKQAYFPVSGGDAAARGLATQVLEPTCSKVFDFGDDPGAANVVKLCGNYMIASSIQSIAETLALAENSGLDRSEVMNMLNSTIFDCLIHKGYGQRVAERDHVPGGFSLELGLKDVTLVNETARRTGVPMSVGSVLQNRWLAAHRKGYGELDWSAVALTTTEDSGVDIEGDLERLHKSVEEAKRN